MEVTKRFTTFIVFLLLFLFGASARAQSDVRTPDQRIYFPQMDPVLTGMWMGNGGADGMRYDAEAIACMVRACADIQATVPSYVREQCRTRRDDNCPYLAVRNSNNRLYQNCYAAHRARITQPGYRRLANPPSMTSLVCSTIAALKESEDETIYTAVNGNPRPKPQYHLPVTQGASQKTRITLRPGEAERMLAELRAFAAPTMPRVPLTRAHVPVRTNVVAPVAKSAVTTAPSVPSGLRGFRIVSQDDKETVLRVLHGADYYTVERSFLAKDHETNSAAVMSYSGNDRTQIFFPYRLQDGKIELYQPRMRLKANDLKGRLGSIDGPTRAFLHGCDNGGCEIRFALQAGETLRIPKKSASPADAPTTNGPVAPVQPDKGTEGSIDEPPASAGALASVAPTATTPVVLETIPISPTPSVDSSPPPTQAADDDDFLFWAAVMTLGFGIVILAHRRYTKRGCKMPEEDAEAPPVSSAGFATIAPPSSHVATFEKQTAASAPPAPQPVQPSATVTKTVHGLGPGGLVLPKPSTDSS